MRTLLFLFGIIILSSCQPDTPPSGETMKNSNSNSEGDLWLEEVEGEAALAWVRKQNERSLADLKADPRYAANEAAAIEILTSKERIPYGSVRDGFVYNFWQDDENVRGLWRRTPLGKYANDEPEWETVLDFDLLAKDEGKNWVFKGSNCFRPKGSDKYVCLVALSDGGKDALVRREFDLVSKSFVEGGFETPEAKQNSDWIDADTLLIGTDWGGDTITESGYPFVLKRWKRGTALADAKDITVIPGGKGLLAIDGRNRKLTGWLFLP